MQLQMFDDKNVDRKQRSTNISGDLDTYSWQVTDGKWFSSGIYLMFDKQFHVSLEELSEQFELFMKRISEMNYFERLTYRLTKSDLIDELDASNAHIVEYDNWVHADELDFDFYDVFLLNPYDNQLSVVDLSCGETVWERV